MTSNMKATVHYQDQPLKQLTLSGLHLIEASAGTGKTWTLSSLMVRILVEKYLPRQVIATTFTRAAAAELKSRIRKRLQEIYRLAKVWQSFHSEEQISQTEMSLSDPLAQIIFQQFQRESSSKNNQQDDENSTHNFVYLVNRLKLVIDSLDELFVGTIDSFIQKTLREFAFDSGEVQIRQIAENEKQYPYQLVHDELRAWLQHQPQELVDVLLMSRHLGSVDHYLSTIQNTLNFNQAKLQEVQAPKIDLAGFQPYVAEVIDQCNDENMAALRPYFDLKGDYYAFVSKQSFRNDKFNSIFKDALPKAIQQLDKNHPLSYFQASAQSAFQQIYQIFLDSKGQVRETIFSKKCPEDVLQKFYQSPLIQALFRLCEQSQKIHHDLAQLDLYLHYYLTVQVKQKLPHLLYQSGETTFSQQTRSLSDALTGERGKVLAEAIQQRYPIILVDEFQDTNQEQDNMLQAVWRDATRYTQGCFIAVGDPKQAIYGFRGGDVLTYLNAFNDIASKQGSFYRLQHNFRSTPRLVEAVDALFQRQMQFGEEIDYYPAQAGKDGASYLVEHGEQDLTPLRFVELEKDANEAYLIAHKIRELLIYAQEDKLFLQDNDEKIKIEASDIAVLANSHHQLSEVQKQLEKLGIDVNRTAQRSVFESTAAQDVAAILLAIERPERDAVLKRALSTPLIGLKASDFQRFSNEADALSLHMQQFRQARQLWLSKGFLLAWQYLATQYQFWQNLAQNMGLDAERSIVNTRHIVELISQQSGQQSHGLQHVLHWYQLQLGSPAQREWELERKLSSESGVHLMTIHKSKGLEFKIVFLMKASQTIDLSKQKLAFYQSDKDGIGAEKDSKAQERIIAISQAAIADNDEAQRANTDKFCAENHRLWYVAITRASYRLYAYFPVESRPKKYKGGIKFWLDAQADAFEHESLKAEDFQIPQAVIDQRYQPSKHQVQNLNAIDYPTRRFYPKTRTSFSAIAVHQQGGHGQLLDQIADNTLQTTPAEDEIVLDSSVIFAEEISTIAPTQAGDLTQLDWIRRHFPKGTNAGNCLHELFEVIDFQHDQYWTKQLQSKMNQYGLWSTLCDAYVKDFPERNAEEMNAWLKKALHLWITQVLSTPLHDGLTLAQLQRSDRSHEFPFYLALADRRFDTQRIHQLFAKYDLDLPEFDHADTARYLNGSIDLVYFDGVKYHIADFKSNFLGEYLQDYDHAQISESMRHSSYWLQASLYLVALHRYLSTHLADYQPDTHLGSANYLYLRGMQTTELSSQPQKSYGVLHWQADLDLIFELDQLFGSKFSDSKIVDKSVQNSV
ncbi:exodeoxyribonuclease V beta subunit [Acinetobacter marinus]|uniref:RecBCD enzyme subunit RecB n=1 Tax=Acinetobacter marinus TaxID=281375 RepID=A0A1G6HFJ3_9GAMM|nr:UvrD-helicase domain-containing protein [Acinetobacter marinus]SDB92705.1 exodeoxyribonuclease V beta subunit [Acinetobacter marinus]